MTGELRTIVGTAWRHTAPGLVIVFLVGFGLGPWQAYGLLVALVLGTILVVNRLLDARAARP